MNKVVVDRAGVELEPGQTVIVHYQDADSRRATVVEIFPDCHTVNEDGRWVDIIFAGSSGSEMMPSYILEVCPDVKDETPRCACCGVEFEAHLGVEGTCRRHQGTRAALMELIRVLDTATERLGMVHGKLFVAAHLSEVLDAIAVAQRSL